MTPEEYEADLRRFTIIHLVSCMAIVVASILYNYWPTPALICASGALAANAIVGLIAAGSAQSWLDSNKMLVWRRPPVPSLCRLAGYGRYLSLLTGLVGLGWIWSAGINWAGLPGGGAVLASLAQLAYCWIVRDSIQQQRRRPLR